MKRTPRCGDPVVYGGRKFRVRSVEKFAILEMRFGGDGEATLGVALDDLVYDNVVGVWRPLGETLKLDDGTRDGEAARQE